MSKVHLVIGIILIVLIAVIGMMTKLVTLGEGIIIILIILVASPFLFNLMRKTPKHDER